MFLRAPADGTVMETARQNVLVVDDDPSYARLAELVLLESLPDGATVRQATSIADALHACAQDAPSCVVLDLSLADGDGLDAIGLLRDAGVGAPVVVLSGRTDRGIAQLAADRGAHGYIVKGDELTGALAAAVAALH